MPKRRQSLYKRIGRSVVTRFRSALAVLAAGVAALAGCPRPVAAQDYPTDYPTRAIRLVVPAAPGGISDILARLIADHLSQAFGQPAVVDNRGGAGGNVGADLVA